ncbi:hypothetical protein IEQ34_003939 [Dendrobium chrysotoxum]|uniref:Uncharacterized protein n=1 Tax=Dendrobium chrysotoxum TaxID=161865 RepID=A0AAV7HDK1_DENCH|nr:hypothetical protein IEQ34_003939 [Dendrobium chrysotoxum]
MGHSKMNYHILHPHLAEAPIINPISINVGDKFKDNVHDNGYAELTLQENMDILKTMVVHHSLYPVGDVGPSNAHDTAAPLLSIGIPLAFSDYENRESINNAMGGNTTTICLVNHTASLTSTPGTNISRVLMFGALEVYVVHFGGYFPSDGWPWS